MGCLEKMKFTPVLDRFETKLKVVAKGAFCPVRTPALARMRAITSILPEVVTTNRRRHSTGDFPTTQPNHCPSIQRARLNRTENLGLPDPQIAEIGMRYRLTVFPAEAVVMAVGTKLAPS